MNESIRATVILLAFYWPKHIKLTRAWCVEIMYIIDTFVTPGCLGLTWDLTRFYPISEDLLKDLDKLGCITSIKRDLDESMLDKAHSVIKKEQEEALRYVINVLTECKDITEAYEWKNLIKQEGWYEKNKP